MVTAVVSSAAAGWVVRSMTSGWKSRPIPGNRSSSLASASSGPWSGRAAAAYSTASQSAAWLVQVVSREPDVGGEVRECCRLAPGCVGAWAEGVHQFHRRDALGRGGRGRGGEEVPAGRQRGPAGEPGLRGVRLLVFVDLGEAGEQLGRREVGADRPRGPRLQRLQRPVPQRGDGHPAAAVDGGAEVDEGVHRGGEGIGVRAPADEVGDRRVRVRGRQRFAGGAGQVGERRCGVGGQRGQHDAGDGGPDGFVGVGGDRGVGEGQPGQPPLADGVVVQVGPARQGRARPRLPRSEPGGEARSPRSGDITQQAENPGSTGNSRVPLHLDDRQLRGAAPGLRAPATPTTSRTSISTKRLATIRSNRNRPCSTPPPTACAR